MYLRGMRITEVLKTLKRSQMQDSVLHPLNIPTAHVTEFRQRVKMPVQLQKS